MDITFISRLFKNLFYYFKSWQCTGQDHQIKSIYLHNLYSRIPKCDCSEKGWHGFDGCFDEFRCRRSGAAVVLLREQANQRQSCLQGIFMGVLDETRRVLWSVCPSPPSAERVPVVQFTTHACETESHAALPLYHLPPWSTPSNTYGLSGCIWGQRASSCSLRNDQEYPLPLLPYPSAHLVSRVPTPLRSEDSGCAVWGMTIHFSRFWLCERKFMQDSEDFV